MSHRPLSRTRRSSPLMRGLLLLSALAAFTACSSFGAVSEHALEGESGFDSAEGRTFFAGYLTRDGETLPYAIALGTTDGLSLAIEHRVEGDSIYRSARREVWAASREEAWAIADDRLFHRTGEGWGEIALPLEELGTDERVALMGVSGAGGRVAVLAGYDLAPAEAGGWVALVFWIDAGDVEIAPLPEGFFDGLETNASGELLAFGRRPHVLREGAWEAAVVEPEVNLRWESSEATGYGFTESELATWSGGEVALERVPIDDSWTGEEGDRTQAIASVRAVGGEVWVLYETRVYGCSTGFLFAGSCGYRLESYRAMYRPASGGEWTEAIGQLDTREARGRLVEIDGEPWLLAPGAVRDGSTVLARFERP